MDTNTIEIVNKRAEGFMAFAEKLAKKVQNEPITPDDVYMQIVAKYIEKVNRHEKSSCVDVSDEWSRAEALAAAEAMEETAAEFARMMNWGRGTAGLAAASKAAAEEEAAWRAETAEKQPTFEEIMEQLKYERENLKLFRKIANGAKRVGRIICSSDAKEVAAVALALSWHGADIKRAFRLARRGCPLLKGSADFAIMKRGDHRGATCKKIANDELDALEFESAMEYALKTPLGKKIVLFVATLPPSMRELVKLRLCGTKIKDCAAAFGRRRVAISKLKKKLINYALEAGLEPRAAVEKKHYTPILDLGPREDDEWIIDLIADEDKTFFGNYKLGFDAENEK